MTDETGQHLRISITVWMTGAFITVVVGVTIFALLIFNKYTGKYSDTMVSATSSTIYQLTSESWVTCPTAYSAVSSSINEIGTVTLKLVSGTSLVVYDYKDPHSDNLISLMTGPNTTRNVRVVIDDSTRSPGLVDVVLEEVVR